MNATLAQAAVELIKQGYSVIPCGPDKRATVKWSEYQTRSMTLDEATKEFFWGSRVAIIGGAISGNLECLDFDDPAAFTPFMDQLRGQRPDLPDKLSLRSTPSGGYHAVYRCAAPVGGNQKLACERVIVNGPGEHPYQGRSTKHKAVQEHGQWVIYPVRIETRGEGGYFLVPPSPGYSALSPDKPIPTLPAADVAIIHQAARSFDQRQKRPATTGQQGMPPPSIRQHTDHEGNREETPGDRFSRENKVADLLTRYGWTEHKRETAGMGWTRPGKDNGTSGVLLDSTGNFYVWSSNAPPLEAERSYTAFGLFTMYEHGGDFTAAARALPTGDDFSRARIGGNGPDPLPDELPPVAPFNFALLPDTLSPWAEDICERMQCPPDFVAAGIMAGLGAVIGRKVGVRPQARTDWTESANLWALVVGRPGVLKSPSLEATLAPLRRLAVLANDHHQFAMAGYKQEATIAAMRAEVAGKAAKRQLATDPNADISDLMAFAEPDEPTLKRYMVNDSTPASLGELLRQNKNGLLVFRDEVVSLLKGLDREDNVEGRGFYLTGWGGNSPYTFDRIGRGLNLHIEAVCLSLLGGTQPGRLAEYISQAVEGGAADDGLIQRFGLLVWPDIGGEWKEVDRWPDTDAKNTAFAVFDHLDKLTPAAIEAETPLDIDGTPDGLPFLRFVPGGLELFQEWRRGLEEAVRSDEMHPALESHFSKYRKLIPSLALIIHLANGGVGPISEGAVLQALAWSDYLKTHAKRAYGAVSNPAVATAKAIIKRIKKGDLSKEFASWEVWRPGWAKLSDRKKVEAGLAVLCEYGHLQETRQETSGRPKTVYRYLGEA